MRTPRVSGARMGTVIVIVVGGLGGGCSGDAASAAHDAVDGSDLSARCEAALAAAQPAATRPLPRDYVADLTVGDETHPLGRIVGAAWHPGKQRLYVLDGINQRVATYDSSGRYLGAFGRRGNGPGEFDELGSAHGSRLVYNQLAVLADQVVVSDFRLLHMFDGDGRFLGRAATAGAQAGPHAIRHVAAFSDTSVLIGETGAMRLDTNDRDVRTGVRLVQAFLRHERVDTVGWGTMRNNLSRFPPFEGMPPRDPYGSYVRRTWDAIPSGLLAVTSQEEHGVCFFEDEGRRLRAYRLSAERIAVDQAERARIREELRTNVGATVPIIGGSWDDFYPVWPGSAPASVDVALDRDSIAWVERLLPDRTRMIDLYHPVNGYLGSREPLGERLPLAFASGCAFVVDEEIPSIVRGDDFFYGLRRWCSVGARGAAGSGDSPP